MMLKPCPCGKIPEELCIDGDRTYKWAYVYGSCCGEWNIEFRSGYNDANSKQCMDLATEAWNKAPRKKGML